MSEKDAAKATPSHKFSESVNALKFLAPQPKVNTIVMHEIVVKSNSLRNQSHLIAGGLVALHFNEQGIAHCPVGHREALDQEMALRPNRLIIVSEPSAEELAAMNAPASPTEEVSLPVVSAEEIEALKAVIEFTAEQDSLAPGEFNDELEDEEDPIVEPEMVSAPSKAAPVKRGRGRPKKINR